MDYQYIWLPLMYQWSVY